MDACSQIVADSPDFFTEDVPAKLRSDMSAHRSWVIVEAETEAVVGFAVVADRGTLVAEILWAAVATRRRRHGLGTRDHVLDQVRAEGVCVVEVKTLDASAGYAPYAATRTFWQARGFVQLDAIDPLPGWPPGNPAAILTAALSPTR